MLSCYGVELNDALQTKIDNHLVLSERDVVHSKGDLQRMISQPNDYFGKEPKIILRLSKSMTFKILVDIVNEIQSFLKPISNQLDFLVYFYLCKCEMFSRHLQNHIAKISDCSEKSVEWPTFKVTMVLPSVSTPRQPSSDTDKKLSQVANYLCMNQYHFNYYL